MRTAILDSLLSLLPSTSRPTVVVRCHAPKVCSNFILDYYITFVAAACSVFFTGRDLCTFTQDFSPVNRYADSNYFQQTK